MDRSEIGIDRRGFLRASAAVGGGVLATGSLTGCTDDGKPSGNKQTGAGKPKKGGALTVALYGAAQTDTLDGQHALSAWDIAISYQLYDSLFSEVRPKTGDVTEGLEIVPNLAESAEYEGDRKLVIRLRQDAEWHNGKPVTAEDVLYSIKRIVDPKNPAPGATAWVNVDLKSSRAVDARTVELVLTKPDAFLRASLAGSYQRMVPVDFDPKNPIGSGPWKLKKFEAGRFASFVPFDNYFNGVPHADELLFQAYADDTALVNALTSGAANLLANVPASQVKLLEANSRFAVLTAPTGAPPVLAMRKKTAPFKDKRVREAFRLMFDRQAIVDQVLNGRGTIGNDLFSLFDPDYNHELPQREHDPEKAKGLLQQAGVSDLALTLATGGFVPNIEVALAQQARAAGVTLNVKKVDQSTFYSQHYGQDPVFSSYWFARSLAEIWALNSLPGSVYNETQEDNADMARLFAEAQATLDDTKRSDLMKEFQQVQHEEGGYVVPAFVSQIDAASAGVAGIRPDVTGKAFGQWNFKDMWLA